MRRKGTPCCPMLSKWPQDWVNGSSTSPQSGISRNFTSDRDAARRPRSRCTRLAYRSHQSNSRSPLKCVAHVKSLSPSFGGVQSPPLCNSPERYRASSINRSQNNGSFDTAYFANGDHGEAAYFSSRPPSEPIHLIFSSLNGHIIGNDISGINSLETFSSSKNMYSGSIKPSKQSMVLVSEESRPRKIQKMVRRLLSTFIQNLPLENDTHESSHEMIPTPGSTTLMLESGIEQRSVSIQASTPSRAVSVGNHSNICNDAESVIRKTKASGREWKGGIRALRDSHLRLLMRHLHHLRFIEKLDRSLKRS